MQQLRINGSRAFGVRPGAPIHFKIPATGNGSLEYHATPLPGGVSLDSKTGIFSGTITEQGEYTLAITVKDDHAQASREFLFIVGDNICLTPFMGWNSWYCHSELISEEAIRSVAKQMVKKGLINHGWSYINIDDCWQGLRKDNEPLQPNERFTDMKALCSFIHDQGLKAGIYSTPWISTYAGFCGGSLDEGEAFKFALPGQERLQPCQLYGRHPGNLERKLDRIGNQWLFGLDAQQWADWGFDFVKVDWKPNDIPTTERIYNDLRHVGRDIVISLSNEAPYDNAAGLEPHSHALRTTGDIEDNWPSVARNFDAQEPWLKFIKPGYWPDPDMLQIGSIATPNRQNSTFIPSALTRDEQYSQMSLWCLLSAPLLITCDIESMDDFTLALLTNDDAIDINQDYPAQAPRRHQLAGQVEVWTKALHDNHQAAGIFNLSEEEQTISIQFSQWQLDKRQKIINAWSGETYEAQDQEVSITIPSHGVALLKTLS